MLRKFVTVLTVIFASLLLAACGGTKHSQPELTGLQPAGANLADPPPKSVMLEQAVAEINAAAVPEGITPELFDKLREQLIRDINARGVSKLVSTPPEGADNQVADLKLYGNEIVGFKLGWTYLNRGDYNFDGLVSVNDLTPIGQNYNENLNGANWVVASRADGNDDGLITVNDITPIGQNYQTFCVGYNVYGSANADGPWAFIGLADLPAASPTGPLAMEYDVPGGGYWYYQIRPVDDEGTEGIPSQISRQTVDPPLVELVEDTFLLTETIGALGGILQTELGSAAEWIRFEFPPDALKEDFQLRIGTNNGSFTPHLGEFVDPIVAFDTGGAKSLLKPVSIKVPVDRNDLSTHVLVPYLVDDEGKLELIDLVGWDSKDMIAEFETLHVIGHLIWVKQLIDISNLPMFELRSTEFTPNLDGLQVVNTGSMWHTGGECFGMTSFSNWYFNTQHWVEGNLFPRFMYEVPIYGGRSGQRIICTRAHTSIVKEWPTYWDNFVGPQGGLNDAQRFVSVVNGIENAGHPVLVDLRHEGGGGGAHSVLAYGYEPDGLHIYDPNAPGVERFIQYNPGSGSFDPYNGYDSIRYSGSGALWLDEPYLSILNDAKHEFAANGFCTITITSHGAGQDVPTGTVTLTGTIESTVEIIDELTINLNGNSVTIAVPSSGNFSRAFTIAPGTNNFWFSTWATRVDDTQVFVPHDLPGFSFSLNGI